MLPVQRIAAAKRLCLLAGKRYLTGASGADFWLASPQQLSISFYTIVRPRSKNKVTAHWTIPLAPFIAGSCPTRTYAVGVSAGEAADMLSPRRSASKNKKGKEFKAHFRFENGSPHVQQRRATFSLPTWNRSASTSRANGSLQKVSEICSRPKLALR